MKKAKYLKTDETLKIGLNVDGQNYLYTAYLDENWDLEESYSLAYENWNYDNSWIDNSNVAGYVNRIANRKTEAIFENIFDTHLSKTAKTKIERWINAQVRWADKCRSEYEYV